MSPAAGWIAPLARFTCAVNRVFAAFSGALAVFILGVVLYDVTLRYLFDDPTVWAIDFASFSLTYLFFFALAPALEGGFHVSIEFFSQRASDRLRRIAAVAASLLAVAFAAVLLWQLLDATITEFAENNLTPTAVPVRVKYIFIIGPIGALQMLLTAVVMAADALRGVRAAVPHGQHEG